ncbi:MAG: glyoxalase [Acidimicrobiia bacterium]
MPDLRGLDVAADPDTWTELGFAVDGGICTIGGVALRLGVPGKNITGWALRGVPLGRNVDGLHTVDAVPVDSEATHPNGTLAIDHVVVLSPVPTRTIDALAAFGLEPRGRRRTTEYGPPYTQTFFRVGRPVLELTGPDEPTDDGPARFFGLAFTVGDLDATVGLLGDRVGPVKEAVQPGRRITTLRREAGAGLPLAFMSEGSTPST